METALLPHFQRGPNVSAANGALELIARVTGLLTEKPREQAPVITHVTVVLNHGIDAEGRGRVVEGEARVVVSNSEQPQSPADAGKERSLYKGRRNEVEAT